MIDFKGEEKAAERKARPTSFTVVDDRVIYRCANCKGTGWIVIKDHRGEYPSAVRCFECRDVWNAPEDAIYYDSRIHHRVTEACAEESAADRNSVNAYLRLIGAICEKKVTVAEAVDKMLEFDKMLPGKGWREIAVEFMKIEDRDATEIDEDVDFDEET